MKDRFYSFEWRQQADRSVAADFLERVVEEGGVASLDARGLWWVARFREELRDFYGVTLRPGDPPDSLQPSQDFRPPGTVQGSGERLTLDARESDVWLAAAFLLDRVEGVSLSAEGTVLLDSPYAGGSTARARNFAEQFGLTVTLNDDRKLKAKWDLRRPRVGVKGAANKVKEALDRYRTPWKQVSEPRRLEIDTLIVPRADLGDSFRRQGGHVIVADEAYRLTPVTAKVLIRDVYLGSARAV